MRYIFWISIILMICSCEAEQPDQLQDTYFFPLKDFMGKEISRLKQQDITFEKTASLNGRTEKQTLPRIDSFEREFAAFINADINKPAYIDQYSTSIDTLEDGTILQAHITNNEDLPTQSLKIWRKNDDVKRIEIISADDNMIYSSGQKLTYIPHSGYSIQALQDVMMAERKDFSIEVRFVER